MRFNVGSFYSGFSIVPVIGSGTPEDLCQCGQRVPVTLELLGEKEEADEITLLIDDNAGNITEKKFSSDEPICFEVTRSEPGFVNFQLKWHHSSSGKETTLERSVGFSVDQIPTLEAAPEDFFTFWEKLFDEASALPEPVRMIQLPEEEHPKTRLYELVIPTLNGKTMHGWLSIPKAEGRYPILAGFPGSGAAGGPRAQFRFEDAITLYLEVHFYRARPGESREETIARAGYDPYNYANFGIGSRDTFFYHDTLPGMHRAIDFVQQLPEYNGKGMGFFGSSQGGWLSVMMGAFHPEVTAMFLNVPAFTQWDGFRAVRIETAKHTDDPGYEKRVRETLRYYSSVHAARRIRASVAMTVGRIDPVCPPASVYALYNQFPGPKVIYHEMDMRHECRDSWMEGVNALRNFLVNR